MRPAPARGRPMRRIASLSNAVARELADDLAPAHDEDAVAIAITSSISEEMKRMPQPAAASFCRRSCRSRTSRRRRCRASARRAGRSTGSAISHLAITTFCWLPPERLLTGCWSIAPDLICSAAANSAAVATSRRLVDDARAAGDRRQGGERDVLGDGDIHHQPLLAPVLGDEGHARAGWRAAA